MNNPDATRYVRERLTAAHVRNADLDVRSRDVAIAPSLFATVRTTVAPIGNAPFSGAAAHRVTEALYGLPGRAQVDVCETHIVVYWNGGV